MWTRIKRLLGIEKEILTGDQASQTSRYGTTLPFDKILERQLENIEGRIREKLMYNGREKLLSVVVQPERQELFDQIKKEFEKRGFLCFYVDSSRVEELKDNTYLFISWDLKEK